MQRYSRKKNIIFLVTLSIIMTIIHGCGKYPASLRELYSELKEKEPEQRIDALRGRRIVIDPGHGGYFDGVIGVDSLREADVNLGVALYLWGLLKDAGAEVYLTRSSDKDFLPEDSRELKCDLIRRVELANSYKPEVFISIHHNSNLPLNRNINKIELYYKSTDPRGSLFLANDVAMHLARNLGIKELDVKPGNYFVLRNSTSAAAILGEASYLSNPWVEEKLKLSEKQKLEAQAYFLGLVDYFSRGIPTIERLSPAEDTVQSPPLVRFRVKEGFSIPIEPSSVKLFFNGREHRCTYISETGEIIYRLSKTIPNGTYTIHAVARSIKHGYGVSEPFKLTISRPPASIIWLKEESLDNNNLRIGVRIFDELGLPVIDGTPVTVKSLNRNIEFSGGSKKGYFYFTMKNIQEREKFVATVGNINDTSIVIIPDKKNVPFIVVEDSLTNKPIPGAFIVSQDSTLSTNENGIIEIDVEKIDHAWVNAQGYNPCFIDKDKLIKNRDRMIRVKLYPIFGGVLKGKKISIDPGGRENKNAIIGVNALREPFVNLQLSILIKDILSSGGARVYITRDGESIVSMQERISIANRSGSEIALRINHTYREKNKENYICILHYPNSQKGKAIAASLKESLKRVYGDLKIEIEESANPFLQQTYSPAVELFLAPVEKAFFEKLLLNPEFLMKEAEAISSAIIEYLSQGKSKLCKATVSVERSGKPLDGVIVTINGIHTGKTAKDGKLVFNMLDPLESIIQIETRDGIRRTYRFKLEPEVINEIPIDLDK